MNDKQNDINNISSAEAAQSEELSSQALDSPSQDSVAEAENAEANTAKENADDNELALLRKKVEQLEGEIKKYFNLSARAQADADNARKRAEREIHSVRMYALESFVIDLLEVKDNLERSLSACNSEESSLEDIHKGVSLTLKLLTKNFDQFGIKEINPSGKIFDPKLHQAMGLLESSEHPANSVIEVMQKGYLLHDRLLRPAMVTISKSLSDDENSQS